MLGAGCASQHVDDVGEKGPVSRLVPRERVEQLRRLGHREREDQPVRLGGRERCLGRDSGGVPIPQAQVRDAGEQMRFNERERGAGRGRGVRNVPKYVQRTGRVSVGNADHCARVVDEAETHPTGFGRESDQRFARLIRHLEPSLRGREPSDDRRRERVHTCE